MVKELEFMVKVAGLAGESSLRFAREGFVAEDKADESPVTSADKASEKLIVEAITEDFPDDGILGEEGTSKESRSGRRWIVDPIDGTRDFIRGNGQWAVLIGLEDLATGEPVAGLCSFPAKGDVYTAARGMGAFHNGRKIGVSSITQPGRSVLCIGGLKSAARYEWGTRLIEWLPQFWTVRSMGGAPDAMMVASGQAEIFIEPEAKAWDLAPLKIITEEAGGRFFNPRGGASIHGGGCVTCTPGLEGVVREFFGV